MYLLYRANNSVNIDHSAQRARKRRNDAIIVREKIKPRARARARVLAVSARERKHARPVKGTYAREIYAVFIDVATSQRGRAARPLNVPSFPRVSYITHTAETTARHPLHAGSAPPFHPVYSDAWENRVFIFK